MKKRQLFWDSDAREDIRQINDYIKERNPAAALRVIDKIEKTGNSLKQFAIGHYGRVEGTYEIGIAKLPYILAYVIDISPDGVEQIVILRVIHVARDWRQDEWPE